MHAIGRGRHQKCHGEVEGVEGQICKRAKKNKYSYIGVVMQGPLMYHHGVSSRSFHF